MGHWITLPGARPDTVIIGGHLDSVPNGGWLDGPLDVLVGIEALRRQEGTTPPVTVSAVDSADEEGARGDIRPGGDGWVGGQGRITLILSPPDPANVAYRPLGSVVYLLARGRPRVSHTEAS